MYSSQATTPKQGNRGRTAHEEEGVEGLAASVDAVHFGRSHGVKFAYGAARHARKHALRSCLRGEPIPVQIKSAHMSLSSALRSHILTNSTTHFQWATHIY